MNILSSCSTQGYRLGVETLRLPVVPPIAAAAPESARGGNRRRAAQSRAAAAAPDGNRTHGQRAIHIRC